MLRTIIFLFSFLLFPLFSCAQTYLIFGDSLSDEGRIYELSDHTVPAPPHFQGRYSNGPLWSEFLNGPRLNFAYAGAKTDRSNVLTDQLGDLVDNTGLQAQIDEYFDSEPDLEALPNTQVIINIGANDFLRLIEMEEPSVEQLQLVIRQAVDNIILAAETLEKAGALPENITLIALPNLSYVPLVDGFNLAQRRLMGLTSRRFNAALEAAAQAHGYKLFDTFGFTNQLLYWPRKFGLKNVNDACYNKRTGEVCAEPETYFFWDEVHPTSAVHRLMALKF